MKFIERVKPISYLKQHTAELVQGVAETGQPVLVTQKGEARVVVMDVATYSRWRDAMALLKILSQSEADATAGKTCSTAQAMGRARAAIRRAGDE